MSRSFLLGVDAGGSKTSVLLGELVDGHLQQLSKAVGASGNPRSVGFDSALDTIQKTITQAFQRAGISPTTASHACFSVAGAGRADERQRILDWSTRCRIATHCVIVGDAECLLAATDTSGVALIAGTGSMAWGRSAGGETARAGGCGFLIDDEGSGYWLAAQALLSVCKAADARQEETRLLTAVLEHLNFSSTDQLIGWCYESSDSRRQIATLAPLVFEQYDRDLTAKSIVDNGARALAGLVAAVSRELHLSPGDFALACAGSVLLRQPVYMELLKAELTRLRIPPQRICLIEDPAEGALQLACDSARNRNI